VQGWQDGRAAVDGAEVCSCAAGGNARWVGRAVCATHRHPEAVLHAHLLLSTSPNLLRTPFPMSTSTPLTPQRLIRRRGRRTATPVAVVDVVFHVFVQLLKEKGALEAHLLDAAVEAQDALARAVVAVFDVGDAAAQVDAFSVVGGFDRGGEVFLRVRAGGWGRISMYVW
jgi:hypothetical protein